MVNSCSNSHGSSGVIGKDICFVAAESIPLLYITEICAVCLFCSIVPGIFGNQQNQHLDSIKQMLHSCLIDQSNAQACFSLQNDEDNFMTDHHKNVYFDNLTVDYVC